MRKPTVYRTSQRPGRDRKSRQVSKNKGNSLSKSLQSQQPARLANAPPENLSRAGSFVELKTDFNLSFGLNLKVSGIKLWHILVGSVRAICSLFSCIFLRCRARATPFLFFPHGALTGASEEGMSQNRAAPNASARKLDALNLRDPIHLARQLSIPINALTAMAENARNFSHPFNKKFGSKMRRLYQTKDPLTGALVRLNRILQRLKLPKAMHGSIRGRSCLSNARPHINAQAWLQLDIKDFFPSITSKRVYAMFAMDCGCSPDVARLLTKLTTIDGHLPQGFPTSPMIANLVARPLAQKLAGLASQHGAHFTQYLDDMTISGPEHVCRLKNIAIKIVRQERFSISPDKIRISRQGQECIV